MAKRYATFEEVQSWQQDGVWKPGGTLGTHHARVISQGEYLVVIGSAQGTVALKPGDTLGYNCGEVWRIPRPDSFSNPLRRALAERHIAQKSLIELKEGEVLKTSSYRCDIWRAYGHGTTNNWWVTDGREESEVVSYKDMTPVNQYCGPEVGTVGQITAATYAVEFISRVAMNGSIVTRVGQIVVWPGYDPNKIKATLDREGVVPIS